MTKTIDGILYLNMIRGGAAGLYANRGPVNDLNVFPIPDGDTGDNMYMTIDAAASKTGENQLLGETAEHVASDMLLGARGNSGVILSRIFAGIGKGLRGVEIADVPAFISALKVGVKEAYGAVVKPVEGTILTVFREGVEHVETHIDEIDTFEKLFDVMLDELRRSLERTPDLLDVLKEAGVVDSGGAGYIYIVEGMNAALKGVESLPTAGSVGGAKKVDVSAFTEDSVLEFGYCTEFLLRLQTSKIDVDSFDLQGFIDWLNSVGDSVVAFREGTIVKAHVHTMHPGDILNYCQNYGEFLTTKIENMTLQHNETHKKEAPPAVNLRVQASKKEFGIVAVAAGEGLREIFSSLGCDVVVDGGQSMNPSAEDLLRAYEEANAKTVYVFPNNSNIVLTAQQAAALCDDTDVRIIKSRTIGEGYAAVSMFDNTIGDADAIEENLNEVISEVVTGMVSVASRDTEQNGVSVKKGEYIGFVDDVIYIDEPQRVDAVVGLAEKLGAGNYDVMLLLAGADTTPEETDAIYKALNEQYKRTEIIVLEGDQPVFDYIMILE